MFRSFFNVFFGTSGVIKLPIWERSNMVILREFPYKYIVWVGNMMALAIVSLKVLLHWQIPKLKVEGKK